MDAREQLEPGLAPGCHSAGEIEEVGVAGPRQDRGGACRQSVVVVTQHDAGAVPRHQTGEFQLETAQRHRAGEQEMALRVDQLLAQIDDRDLLAVAEHRLDGMGLKRLNLRPRVHHFSGLLFVARVSAAKCGKSATGGPAPRVAALMRATSALCRLLRCHLVHLAGIEVEAHAVDLVEIGSGDAHEAGLVRIVDGMDGTVLVDAGVPRQQAVFLDRLELGRIGSGASVLAGPLGHVSVIRSLPVDRPGGTVVVRRRHPRLVVDVGEHLEAELRILVEHLQAARHLIAAIFFHERLVRQQTFERYAHLLAAFGPGIALENGAAIRHERIEVVRHGDPPCRNAFSKSRSSHRKAPGL